MVPMLTSTTLEEKISIGKMKYTKIYELKMNADSMFKSPGNFNRMWLYRHKLKKLFDYHDSSISLFIFMSK